MIILKVNREDFSKQKIVWIELTDNPNFTLDTESFYINNTVFFMTGNNLEYILAFLNSKVCEWYFDKICATSGAGTRRWIKMYIDQIRIPTLDASMMPTYIDLTSKIINNKRLGLNIDNLDNEINILIYKVFGFLEDEVSFIECQ